MRKILVWSSSALLLLVLAAGCDSVEMPTVSDEVLQEALAFLLDADEAFSIDGLADSELVEDNLLGKVVLSKAASDTLWRDEHRTIRWGRSITDHSREISFSRVGDDTVLVTVVRTVVGQLRAEAWDLVDSTLVLVDSLVKDISLATTRKVRFIRADDTGRPKEDWRIDGMTPIFGKAGSKVALDNIAIAVPGFTSFSISSDDILDAYFTRDDLPAFLASSLMKMTVVVSNTGPVFPIASGERVTVRFGRPGFKAGKVRLNDLGWNVDEVANDDQYTGVWYVHDAPTEPRVFHLFLDVMDLGSLFVAGETYHTEFVGIPYLVTPGVQ